MLFAEVRVWKRLDDGPLVLYRCVRQVRGGLYAVQSADVFGATAGAQPLAESDARFVELLRDTSPRERCSWHDTGESAIAAHDRDFS